MILSKQTESVVNDFQIKLFMGIKVVSAKYLPFKALSFKKFPDSKSLIFSKTSF